jgi:hypothetical protein
MVKMVRASVTKQSVACAALTLLPVFACQSVRAPAPASSAAAPTTTTSSPPPLPAGAPTIDPFDGLTPARIDALDSFGLCFEACRINLQCLAKRDPAGYPSVKAMAGDCQQVCLPARLTKANPAETTSLRKCLRKLDCAAFDECAFGPPAPLKPPASSQPPARP